MTKKKICVTAGVLIGVVAAVVAAKRIRGIYDMPDRDS